MSEKLEKLGGYVVQGVDFPQNLDLVLGSGLKAAVDETEKTLTISTDETVLWEGDTNGTVTLSENINSFEYVEVFGHTHNGSSFMWSSKFATRDVKIYGVGFSQWSGTYKEIDMSRFSIENTTLQAMEGCLFYGSSFTSAASYVTKVVGINRKQA